MYTQSNVQDMMKGKFLGCALVSFKEEVTLIGPVRFQVADLLHPKGQDMAVTLSYSLFLMDWDSNALSSLTPSTQVL